MTLSNKNVRKALELLDGAYNSILDNKRIAERKLLIHPENLVTTQDQIERAIEILGIHGLSKRKAPKRLRA